MKSLLETVSSFFSKAPQESKGRKGWSLLGFLIIGLLGGVYFFHVSTQQEYLTKRNFRVLELWNQELSKKIQSFESVFDFSAEHPPPILLKDLPKHTNTKRFGIFGPEGNQAGDIENWIDLSCFNGHKRRRDKALNPYFLAYRNLCDTGLTDVSLQLISSDPEKFSDGLSISAPENKQQSTFHLSYTRRHSKGDPANTQTLLVTSKLNLENFLTTLTKDSIFDDVIVFNSKGNVIFQQSSIEFNWSNWGQLWHHKVSKASSSIFTILGFEANQNSQKPPPSAFTDEESPMVNVDPLPTSFTISISDVSYQVFAQPTDLLSTHQQQLLICGIIAADRFRQDTLAVSSTALLILMVILGLLTLSMPLLRLKMIGPTDPLRLSHMFMLVFSCFLGAGLLTSLLLDFVIYREAKSVINEQTEKTAQSIQQSMHNELSYVLKTLKEFDTSKSFVSQKSELDHITQENQTHRTYHRKKSPKPVLLQEGLSSPCVHLQPSMSQPKPCYPHYYYAFWTDEQGTLRMNWTNKNERDIEWKGVIDNISLQNRQYIDRVLHHKNSLWQLNPKNNSQRFYLEPITSWNTGWNSVVASIPSHIGQDPAKKDPPWVAAMEFQFLSLMKDLVLPPGAGFAMIHNHDYQVLFHSTPTKNLRENFWAETEYDPYLRDLVFARMPGHFDGKYWGEDTHFYVLPISPMPWSIVVYQKKEMLRSVNFVILLISGGIFGFWSIMVLAGAGLLMGLFQWEKHRKAEWLWPRKEHDSLYRGITVFNAIACLLGFIFAWTLGTSPGPLIVLGLLYPVLAVAALAGLLRYCPTVINKPAQWVWISAKSAFPTSYALMVTSFLVLCAVLPAFFTFKTVFFQEMSLVVKHQLMDVYQNSQSRKYLADGKAISHALPTFDHAQQKDACRTLSHDRKGQEHPSPSLPFGIYPNAFLKTYWFTHSEGCPQHTSSTFDSFYRVISQPFVPLRKGIQEWGFLHDFEAQASPQQGSKDASVLSSTTIRWLPSINQYGQTISLNGPLNYQNTDSPSFLHIWADVPLRPWILLFDWPTIRWSDIPWWLIVLLVFTGYVRILYRCPRFIADQVLFLSYTVPLIGTFPPKLIQEENGHTPNLLILGYPGQGKTSQFSDSEKDTSTPLYTDLRSITAKDLKSIEEDCETESNPVVIVDHFDWRWDEPTINQRKLEFLEKLLGWHREPEPISPPNLRTNFPGSNQNHSQTESVSRKTHTAL